MMVANDLVGEGGGGKFWERLSGVLEFAEAFGSLLINAESHRSRT